MPAENTSMFAPFRSVLPPVTHTWLVLHVVPPAASNEQRVMEDLHASHEYLRQFVPCDGLVL